MATGSLNKSSDGVMEELGFTGASLNAKTYREERWGWKS